MTADQVNLVVVVVKVSLANVLDLVLENRVNGIRTANQVNIVAVLMIRNVSKLALVGRVTQLTTVLWGNVVITIINVKQEIAS
jgi:hypothetical protein